ncbi:MAG: phosphodiester glycosidase family protein [Oscillospiraceae bacterium]|nr:phosphodiester glycosidase family protein [Oscillospiraceae bacterium]
MHEENKIQAAEQASGGELAAAKMIVSAVIAVFSIAMTAVILVILFMGSGSTTAATQATQAKYSLMDRFDMFVTNEMSNALDGIVVIKKQYRLDDSDLVAPKPNEANFGQADTAAEMEGFLSEASHLLEGQETIFKPDTEVWDQDKIYYYQDETIMVITWKQIIDKSVYTFSEVKIAHPSQFRRFLAGGEFGFDKQYFTTEMADSVNAVVASSGDFYKYRRIGIMVYDGKVQRMGGEDLDTCFIDDKGDLDFVYRGELTDQEAAQQYVDDNNIRFSLAFGPVLVDNGEVCVPNGYIIGEINLGYSRAALCQVDELHYLLVTLNGEKQYQKRHLLKTFAGHLAELGVQKAYALDGGQTATIAMQGRTINEVDYGTQRQISDIIYFATALPEGE